MSQPRNTKLRRYLKISLGLHLGIFAFLVVGQWVAPNNTEMFQPTVQIDMVALPDLVKSQSQPLDTTLPVKDAPPPARKEEAAEKDEPTPAPVPEKESKKEREAESDAKKALERLRAEVKKEQKEEDKRRRELVNKREEELKRFEETYRAAIKGNQVNQGTSATGAMQATLNAYVGHIREKLNGNWALPVWLQSAGLRAEVRMYLDARGNIIRYTFTKSSGNQTFDEYVEGTLKRSSPFAPPPEEMAKGLRNSGIGVQFPL